MNENNNLESVNSNLNNVNNTIMPNTNNEVLISNDNNQTNINNINQNIVPKKKNKLGLIIGIVVCLLVIGGGVFFALNYFKKDSKQVFNTIVNVGSNKIKEFLTSDDNFIMDLLSKEDNFKVKLSGDFSLNAKDSRYYISEPRNMNYTTNIDLDANINRKAKKLETNLKLGVNNEDLLDGSAIVSNNMLYAKLKDFSKYYSLDQYVDFDQLFEYSSKDITQNLTKVVTYLQESINETITKEDIKEEKTSIDLDNNNINVTKYSIHINNDLVERIKNKFKEKIKNDEVLSKDFKFDEANNDLDINTDFTYYISDDSKLVLMELNYTGENSSNYLKIINYNNVYKVEYNQEYKIFAKCEDCSSQSINFKTVLDIKKDNNNYSFELTSNDNKVAYGNIIIDNKDIIYNINLSMSEDEYLTLDGKHNTKKVNDEISYTGNTNINIKNIDQKIEFKANYKFSIAKSNLIDDSKVDNATNYNNMSLEDQEILNNFVQKIEDSLSNFIPSDSAALNF